MSTLIFCDSVLHYTTPAQAVRNKWTSFPGNNSVIVGGGRNGGNAIQSSFPQPVLSFGGAGFNTLVLGAAVQFPTYENVVLLAANAASSSVGVQLNGDGTLSAFCAGASDGTRTSLVLTTNAWYYLEVELLLSGSVVAGNNHWILSYDIHVNGNSVLTGTITATGQSTPTPTMTGFFIAGFGGGFTSLTTDIYITDTEFFGDVSIKCLWPADQGDLNAFTPSSVLPLRTPSSTINVASALYTNLVGLWVANEGSGVVDTNLVDSTLAALTSIAWNDNSTVPNSNVMTSTFFAGFPANASQMNCGHAAALDHLTVNKFTISMAINSANNHPGLLQKWDGVAGHPFLEMLISANGGANNLEVFIGRGLGTPLDVRTIDGSLPANSWFQLTITWDGTGAGVATDVHIYVNGVECAYAVQNNGAGAIGDESGSDLLIGTVNTFNHNTFSLGYLAVYKGRILSTAEMNTLNSALPITQGDADVPNWRYDNDHSPDDTNSVVQSTTPGDKDLYIMDQIAGSPHIFGAQFLSLVEKSDAGDASTKNIMKSSGVEFDGAEFFPSAGSWLYNREAYRKSAFTGIDWTVAEINAIQDGVKRQS